MKYESRRFHQDRWGSVQAESKSESSKSVQYVSNTAWVDPNIGGTMQWVDPSTGAVHTAQYNAPSHWVPFDGQIGTVTPDSGQQAKAELEVLRHSLSFCLICGLDQVFVLCSLCRETVREARQKMLDGMVESIRSIGE